MSTGKGTSATPSPSGHHPTSDTNTGDAVETKQRQHLENLSKDYATISKLMVNLDKEVKCLTASVGSMVHSVPAHDGLSAMLETLADSTEAKGEGIRENANSSAKKMRRDKDDAPLGDDDAIMGDEAAEKDDPLVFL
mmetsp:Transcript_26465/g.58021  ORF Transcript_26465/g.58021 Transcript_26465/m.58021 type:complete len:137 (+) Transcript_26465:404-814(+)